MIRRVLWLLGLLVVSWGVMLGVHEAGHLLGGWVSGARLVEVWWGPWPPPYSLFQPDPHPLVTLWGGPLLGAGLPLLVACLWRRQEAWFVAWFCLLANGLYLAVGACVPGDELDTAKLLKAGASPISIGFYVVVTISVGYVGLRRSLMELFSPAATTTLQTEVPQTTQ